MQNNGRKLIVKFARPHNYFGCNITYKYSFKQENSIL